jgi:hypothetical protein
VAILLITAINLWIFPLQVHDRENEKKEKSKKRPPRQTRKLPQTDKGKRTFLENIRKIHQAEKNKKKIPDEIKKTPQTEKRKKELPGEIKETPKRDKSKKEIPDEIKKTPETEKIKKKIPDEIISISKLDQAAKEFSINRDIFSPELMKPVDPGSGRKQFTPPTPPPVVKDDLPSVDPKADIEEEIQGLSYEGYVIKNSKNCALVSMNGEFHAVTVGDIILEKIKIIEIDRKIITVELESHEFEIQIKEDEQNEIK